VNGSYAVIMDGTAALPSELQRELNIRVLPLHVIFGEESYTAGVDLSPEQFYGKLGDARVRPPTTSAPSLGEAREAYDAAIRQGQRQILVLTIATELSATFSVLRTAAEQVGDARVEVVDTRSTAGAISLIATACARARRDGRTFDDAVGLARRLAGRVQVLAVVDTLEQLKRSGRATGLQALFGSLLAVKPILEVTDGRVQAIGKVRTRERALAHLRELLQSRLGAGGRVHFCALHTNDPERARALAEWAQGTFHCVEHFVAEAGPVIAAHAGPGVVGACFYRAEEATP
jgi:DegV family protein with EDD domain